MQPSFHDAYKRDNSPGQWARKAQARSDAHYEEQEEDQWAILRHEVEEEDMQQRKEDIARPGWDQRDTEGEAIAPFSPMNDPVQAPDELLEPSAQNVDIVVAGVGGGGMNAINRMMHTRVRGVRFVAMNTDAQVLALSPAPDRICLGQHHTKGLGAGGVASAGLRAATESAAEIRAVLGDADLVFIAAGMGGGTGTGAAPVAASIAKKLGALTVGIVTLPFSFEGTQRRRIAEKGLADLSAEVDALITVPNDRLLVTVARECNLSDAFRVADDVLRQGVQGIAEVINVPGLVNVDFADVRSVLREAGSALMSIGSGKGSDRARQAAEEAVAGGFLNVTIRGARRVLFNISGGEDMTLFEVNEVAERIGEAVDSAADITFGAVIDPTLRDSMRVTLIAAGMDEEALRHGDTIRSFAMSKGLSVAPLSPMQDTPPARPFQERPQPRRIAPTPPPTQLPPTRRPPNNKERSRRPQQQDRDIDIPPFMRRRYEQ